MIRLFRRARRPVVTAPDHIAVQVLAHHDGVENVMVVPMTCTRDHLEHAVTDIEVDRARQTRRGIYRAICTHTVAPGSLATPPGRPCRACLAVLAQTCRLAAGADLTRPPAGAQTYRARRAVRINYTAELAHHSTDVTFSQDITVPTNRAPRPPQSSPHVGGEAADPCRGGRPASRTLTRPPAHPIKMRDLSNQ